MKTVLLLTLFLYAASAAPAEDKPEAPEAVAVVDPPEEQMAAVPAQEEVAAPEAKFKQCPADWHPLGSNLCYTVVTYPKSWYNANQYCIGLGGQLASITMEENFFLQDLIQSAGQSKAWLGGSYNGKNWVWTDGKRVGSDSDTENLLSPYQRYRCLYLSSNDGWINTGCTTSQSFICSRNL